MARLNATKDQAQDEPRRRTGLRDTSIEQPDNLDKVRSSTGGPSRNSSHKKKSSGVFFNIFPDSEQTREQEIEEDATQTSSFMPPRKQKTKPALKAAPVNSLLLPLQRRRRQRPNTKAGTDDYDKENDLTEDTMDSYSVDPSPQPSPRRNTEHTTPESGRLYDRPLSRMGPGSPGSRESESESEESHGDDSFNSLDDFVVSDNSEPSCYETSESETDAPKSSPPPPPKSTRKRLLRGRRPRTSDITAEKDVLKSPSPGRKEILSSLDDKVSQNDAHLVTKLNKLILEEDLEDLEDQDDTRAQAETNPSLSIIELDSPLKSNATDKGAQTPPSSPSPRRRIQSPNKKPRIPPTPHRESMDAFWDQQETNNWNDEHSPQKPKTDKFMMELLQEFDNSDGEGSSQDSGSGLEPIRLSPTKAKEPRTPSKTAIKKAEAEARRAEKARRQAFDDKKEGLAKAFLHDLDMAVTGGQIIQLAEEAGGVEIVWSKTLQKTAGRATWKATHRRSGAPIHYAKIELADRILVDEYRLTNTLTHEYCHLANYMISKVIDQPHGPSFKCWGKKCADAMSDHPEFGGKIHVTTKHSYKIDYKYVWACVDCGCQFGRHSKSLNTERFSCGTCRGKLEQIKPKPRNMSPKKGVTPSNFQNLQKKPLEYAKLNLDELNF